MEQCKIEHATQRAREDKTSCAAWLVTVAIMLVNSACAIMWVSCASAPLSSAEWMGADLSMVNWLSNVCAIDNSVFSLVCIWAYERFGVKRCAVFAAVINVVGSWIRCIAIAMPVDKRYPVVMLGQAFAGVGGPFIYNIAPKLTAVWFAPRDRNLGATLGTLSWGQIAGPLFIPAIARTADHVPRMLLITAIIATVCAIPIMLTPALPKVPPTNSAASSRLSVWQGVKRLVRTKDYWLIAIPAVVNAGMFFTMTVVVIEAAAPYGYDEQQGGIADSLLMAAGVIGGCWLGFWIGRTGEHLAMIKLFTPLMCGAFIMLNFTIVAHAFGALLCGCVLLGFFGVGLYPAQLEYASELSYPVPESVSSNLTWSLVTGGMLVFTVITDSLRAGPEADPPNNMKLSLIVASAIVCAGSLPCIWLKGELKRLAVDQASTV